MDKTKTITRNWNGTEIRETFICNKLRFRVITGLRNGGATDAVKMLGTDGWKFLIGKDDIDKATMNTNVSYVSDEIPRKIYAENLNRLLKLAVVKLFT